MRTVVRRGDAGLTLRTAAREGLGVRRGCLFGCIALLGLCVVACALGYAVGLPRFREGVREPLEDVIGTQVALQMAPNPGVTPAPGTYVIREDELNAGLQDKVDRTGGFDKVTVSLAPDGFTIRFTTNDNDVTYRGDVAAVDGRFVVTEIEADGWLTFFLPAKEVRKALENEVNGYLAANNLRLADAELGDGTLSLTTEAA
jgi:hypothetical protein